MGTPTRARPRPRRWSGIVAALLLITGLSSCVDAIDGSGTVEPASLTVAGFSGSAFDVTARNALDDVIGFWEANYPKISGGAALPMLKGKLYSIDGDAVVRTGQAPAAAETDACIQQKVGFIVDNAAYCELDDSIVYDRSDDHLVPVLSKTYGPTLTAMVFAHEFGHAIQQRLGIDKLNLPTIVIESQADCASGAFIASALKGEAPHFHVTSSDLDEALAGYFQVRDTTPDSPADISHGNGFDRLNAIQEGIDGGVTYCYSKAYLAKRNFTERAADSEDVDNGNEPLTDVLAANNLSKDLNRYWKIAGRLVHKQLKPVELAEAAHPKCGAASPASDFGYCPDDNTVYYSGSFARSAYDSITSLDINQKTATVSLVENQPGDFALGQLISIAWGMAAAHQFFGSTVTSEKDLVTAVCYSGAYAHDINLAQPDRTHPQVLAASDMDEAVSATLSLVPLGSAFSARGTTALQRVQAFVLGYDGGLSGCSKAK